MKIGRFALEMRLSATRRSQYDVRTFTNFTVPNRFSPSAGLFVPLEKPFGAIGALSFGGGVAQDEAGS